MTMDQEHVTWALRTLVNGTAYTPSDVVRHSTYNIRHGMIALG